MTATQPTEALKATFQLSANKTRRGLNGRVLFGALAVLAALFAVGMLPRWRANAALTSSVRDQRPTVSVIASQHPGADDANLVLPGSTQAIQETAIYARTNGYVRKWNVDIGAKVEAGQLLAEIETPEVDQELNQARANVAQAAANLDLARATLTRWQKLVDQKVVAPQEFDEKKSAADARDADLKVAQANVKRLEELQGFEKIFAPFTGIVTARNIDNGNLVSAGSGQTQPLFRIAQTDTLRIYVTVPQTQSRSIVPEQNATVSVREIPDKTFNAKVVRTAGALDPASRTLLTELQVPNADGQLFPGMYAEVKFTLPHDDRTLVVPGNAVMIRSDGPKVLVVDAKQTIRARAVKLGRDLGDKVEIASGLDPSESIVANPTDSLHDGAEVKVQAQASKPSDQSTKPTKG
ncbi:MAG TPA: efflux RND transporter periplasmic adaptor subunit [Candidatus Udaeobacter sp.]|jgi:RND family efflux transporter MFP subunit